MPALFLDFYFLGLSLSLIICNPSAFKTISKSLFLLFYFFYLLHCLYTILYEPLFYLSLILDLGLKIQVELNKTFECFRISLQAFIQFQYLIKMSQISNFFDYRYFQKHFNQIPAADSPDCFQLMNLNS